MRINIGINADSPFYLYANADPDPGSQANADGRTLKSQKCRTEVIVGEKKT
jgi:hypothetical protein